MNQLSDDELRSQLERRVTGSPLTREQRVEAIEAVHAQTAAGRSRQRWQLDWRWLPSAAVLLAIVVVVVVAFPRTPSAPPASPTDGVSPSPTVAPSATPAEIGPVLNTDQLASVVAAGESVGEVVLARITVVSGPPRFGPTCLVGQLCQIGAIVGTNPELAVMAQRDEHRPPLPSDERVFAFRLLADQVGYMGVVTESDEGVVRTVADTLASAPAGVSEDLYAVNGWLMRTVAAPCRAPPVMSAPSDYWCGGSWITAEAPAGPDDGTTVVLNPGGIHVQWDAYQTFAPDPQFGNGGGDPRVGIYLIRSAGCPDNVMGDCPVFEMVARVDLLGNPRETSAPSPEPTPSGDDRITPGPRAVPSELDGQPVYSGPAITEHLAMTSDDAPFLISGGIWYGIADCMPPPSDFPDTPLLHRCGPGMFILESPSSDDALVRIGLFLIDGVTNAGGLSPTGQTVVLRVHIHDAAAAACPAAYREECESAMVLEEEVWP